MYVSGVPASSSDLYFILNGESNLLLGNWTFNEGSGTWANDTSGFNNNGTITGATWTIDAVNGSALSFNGSGNHIDVAGTSAIDFGNLTSFTISSWAKPNNTGTIFYQDQSGGFYVAIDVIDDGSSNYYVMFRMKADGVWKQSNTNLVKYLTPNKWYNIMVIGNGTSINLYINNVLYSSSTTYSDIDNAIPANTKIGQNSVNFNGVIDELKVYNYALNLSERTAIYQQFQPVPAYPTGGIVIPGVYPPLTTSIAFSWHDTEYSADELIVAEDAGFNIGKIDIFTSNDYYTTSLVSGKTYYWKVRQYNTTSGTYGDTSDVEAFSIAQTTVGTSGTGIHGVVSDLGGSPISGATIYLYNSSYSISTTTGDNGYYLFSPLVNNSVYNIYATKSGYDTTPAFPVSTGNGTFTTNNIKMTLTVNPYIPEYIFAKFILYYTNTTMISNAEVSVFKGNEVIATYTGTTGDDGDVTFQLIKTQKYRVVFKDSGGNSLVTWVGYPQDTIYVEVRQDIIIIPSTPPTNMTNVSTTNGTYNWSLSDFTGSNLTSVYGIGVKGQGVITGIIALIMIPYGGTVAVITIFSGLVLLGVMSYKFALYMAMVSVAWYIVKKEFA